MNRETYAQSHAERRIGRIAAREARRKSTPVGNRASRRAQGRTGSAGAGRRFREQQARYTHVLPWRGQVDVEGH